MWVCMCVRAWGQVVDVLRQKVRQPQQWLTLTCNKCQQQASLVRLMGHGESECRTINRWLECLAYILYILYEWYLHVCRVFATHTHICTSAYTWIYRWADLYLTLVKPKTMRGFSACLTVNNTIVRTKPAKRLDNNGHQWPAAANTNNNA